MKINDTVHSSTRLNGITNDTTENKTIKCVEYDGGSCNRFKVVMPPNTKFITKRAGNPQYAGVYNLVSIK